MAYLLVSVAIDRSGFSEFSLRSEGRREGGRGRCRPPERPSRADTTDLHSQFVMKSEENIFLLQNNSEMRLSLSSWVTRTNGLVLVSPQSGIVYAA